MLPATRMKQLAQSIDLVVDAVHSAPVDQYQNPTPCSAWTVKDLVNHIAMMLLMTRGVGNRAALDPGLLTANPVPLLAGRPETEWASLLACTAESAAMAWSEPTAWEGEAGLGGPPHARDHARRDPDRRLHRSRLGHGSSHRPTAYRPRVLGPSHVRDILA